MDSRKKSLKAATFGASRRALGERQQKKKRQGVGEDSLNLVKGFGFLFQHFSSAQYNP